jgi:hypothetical protein
MKYMISPRKVSFGTAVAIIPSERIAQLISQAILACAEPKARKTLHDEQSSKFDALP